MRMASRKEVIIPWAQFCEMSEALGLDLDEEAIADLRETLRRFGKGRQGGVSRHSPRFERMPRLIVHKRAMRYLQRMDRRLKAQLVAKLEELARNPDSAAGVKPMAGEWAGFFRLRHGDLRVIFMHDRTGDAIIVAHVGPRGDIYK